ncbi:PAQR family membrane homeostasis protein TrhA [Longimicrobium terrae]|uniref:Hemolysin III n=1 Tax=Longimicrobium terrae TaxID=1639882 RepID=A0A841GTU6_9BACT|nr:hemolysin III family protein [Longimicrobium terrae]MBB4635675.1 hemolysin III [Longimicrobium terrae]MBB6070069.1 hemolysin III [Longimicrobium terrae]NNC32973.1 hemolysin III family protein [Longimicrobium terrae]
MDASNNPREELANAITHGVGALAGAVGALVLVVGAALHGDIWQVVSSAVFGASLVLLYTASTLYHAARDPRTKARLQILDHCAIYLLIAGSYTPFTLIALRGGWGWSLFGVAWALAVAGVIFKLFFTGRFPRLSTGIYIGMGWMAVVAAVPMLQSLSAATLGWLVAGGVTYTAGTVFYHNRRPYAHAIWHLFVLAGSTCHFIAVATQVLPPS